MAPLLGVAAVVLRVAQSEAERAHDNVGPDARLTAQQAAQDTVVRSPRVFLESMNGLWEDRGPNLHALICKCRTLDLQKKKLPDFPNVGGYNGKNEKVVEKPSFQGFFLPINIYAASF